MLSIGSPNAALLIISYLLRWQNKRVKDFFEIWIKIILLDVLYLGVGMPLLAMVANINLIVANMDETILTLMASAGAGLLWSATIISICVLIILYKYVGRRN